jgi:hypothetical protein
MFGDENNNLNNNINVNIPPVNIDHQQNEQIQNPESNNSSSDDNPTESGKNPDLKDLIGFMDLGI